MPKKKDAEKEVEEIEEEFEQDDFEDTEEVVGENPFKLIYQDDSLTISAMKIVDGVLIRSREVCREEGLLVNATESSVFVPGANIKTGDYDEETRTYEYSVV